MIQTRNLSAESRTLYPLCYSVHINVVNSNTMWCHVLTVLTYTL